MKEPFRTEIYERLRTPFLGDALAQKLIDEASAAELELIEPIIDRAIADGRKTLRIAMNEAVALYESDPRLELREFKARAILVEALNERT